MKIGAVVATGAMVLSQLAAIPAYACSYSWCGGSQGSDNSVYIKVENSGSISNTTEAKADTGDNKAKGSYGGDGGYAGDGGKGGSAEVEGDEVRGECGCELPLGGDGTANGGDGADGGDADGGDGDVGGTVQTGDARSEAGSINVMNTTMIRVVR